MRTAVLLTALILGCVSPAVAAPSPPGPSPVLYGPPSPSFPQRANPAYIRLRSELLELRRVGLEWRASDGGTLSAEHRDALQARIDAAYQRYFEAQPGTRPR